jgi:hypothetical protein
MNALEVVAALLGGALDHRAAAAKLGVPDSEMSRILRSVGADGAAPVPVDLDIAAGRVAFLDMAGARFEEPFFDDTVDRVRGDGEPRSRLDFDLGLDDFLRAAERRGRSPDGFLFHTGRCGSTLLANMLAASADHLLLKEPGLVNSFMAQRLVAENEESVKHFDELVVGALRLLAGAAVEARPTGPQCIVKLAAWNVQMADLLFERFPHTHAVFVYREPVETAASLLFQRPAWFDELIDRPPSLQARFFPSIAGWGSEILSPVELFAHAWRSVVESTLALPSHRVLLLEYPDLLFDTVRAVGAVLRRFGYDGDTANVEGVLDALDTYSKDPSQGTRFAPSGRHRRPTLAPEHAKIVRSITDEVWEVLRERRDRGSA